MLNIKEFYTTGLPIETDIGLCHFIKIKDYPTCFMDLQIMGMSKDEIINKYSKLNKDGSLNEFLNELNKHDLFEIISSIPEIQVAYYNIFLKVFLDEESLSKITPENFNSIRLLIMEMNCIKEEEINPNPEIQKAIERSRRVKNREGEKLTFADMSSSIVAFSGKSYDELNEMTIYQFYMTYYRIAQIKNYDTSTLFATVSSEKINIESWSKHIDLFADEKHSISHDEFKKTTGSVFDE
ncbi:hypothetical protein AB0Y20_01505 [Heyndrickxia oleronia]|uniref:hypothetical protein n=1 Tax=Heyndrickxia oleronia TaxID=38875 RepID=UPI003F2187E9